MQEYDDQTGNTGAEQVVEEPSTLKYFDYTHLPKDLQSTSRMFCELANALVLVLKPGPELSTALRKLLESKDAAVRAQVHPGG